MRNLPEPDSVEHILSTARSVRRKLDFSRPVSREDLEACINVAVQAPTGIVGENWRFLIVTEADRKARIAELYRTVLLEMAQTRGVELKKTHHALMDRLHEIPCMVFVYAIGEPDASATNHVGFYGSILPAAWSLMLAMRARGIGTTWTSLLRWRASSTSPTASRRPSCCPPATPSAPPCARLIASTRGR